MTFKYKKCMLEYETKINIKEEKPLVFIITGAGMEVFKLAQVPGASKILTSIFVPYCWEQSVNFISENLSEQEGIKFKERAVSSNSAELLCKAGLNKWADCKVVSVTAAATTNEYRRGDNHAYVSCGELVKTTEWKNGKEDFVIVPKIDTYHISLTKLTEEEHKNCKYIDLIRLKEDQEIADFAIKLAFGKINKI